MNQLQLAQDLSALATSMAKDLGCDCDLQVAVALSARRGKRRVHCIHEHHCSMPDNEAVAS